MVTRLTVLVLLVATASPSLAGDAPWEVGPARREAERVVTVAQRMLHATEMRDARPAVEALRDPSWQLRQLAIERLEVLGLPPRWVTALAPITAPDASLPEADWPPFLAARDYADALEVAATKPPEIKRTAAAEAVAVLVAQRLVDGDDPGPLRRRLLHELLALTPLFPPARRVWLATAALTAVDPALVLRDLRRRSLEDALGDDGRDVLRWFGRSHVYLYWHPGRRRFELDVAARRAGEPSDAFRQHTPWPPGEGPRAR